ncbi:MAG: ATP-binding cassette domain-containing protein [Desulfarculus sp.]|nr:ATP-binding cassette domain-containing protein [Desulfarculus sp.]
MIQVQAVSQCFQALGEVSLTIEPGEFVCLVGPSGCGKTTLLNLMAGLQRPSQRRVLRQGRPLNGCFGWAGYLSQADTLLPWRTVWANVEIGLELPTVPAGQRRQREAGLIQRVGLAAEAMPGLRLSPGGLLKPEKTITALKGLYPPA